MTTNIDLGVSECGNPKEYAFSEFQSNLSGYQFSEFDDPLEVIMLAIYHPLAVRFWISIDENHSIQYWLSILIRYLKTFPLIFSCSIKKSEMDDRELAYIVPQLLMQWIVQNKDFCDGILYFPRSVDIGVLMDLYKYNVALPATPPFDENGHSINLKKLLRWSEAELKRNNPNIISQLTISTKDDKNDEFIRACTWLNSHHVPYSKRCDKDIEGVSIQLRQWKNIIDIRDKSCIKFVLNEFNPEKLKEKLRIFGIPYLKDTE